MFLRIGLNQKRRKDEIAQGRKQQEKSGKCTQLLYSPKWIFHSNRAIELNYIDRNSCLIYKKRRQHSIDTFLRLNIFFLDGLLIVV